MRRTLARFLVALLLITGAILPSGASAQTPPTGITYFQYTNNAIVGPNCVQTVIWKFRPPITGVYQVYRWWYDAAGVQRAVYPGASSPWYASFVAGTEHYISHQMTNDAAFVGGASSRYRLIIFHPNGAGAGTWSQEPWFTSSDSPADACNVPTPTPPTCSAWNNLNIHRVRIDAPTIYTGQTTGTLGYEYNIFCGWGSVDRVLRSSTNQLLHGQAGARNDAIRADFQFGGSNPHAVWHQVYIPCSATIGIGDWFAYGYSDNETLVNVVDGQVNIQRGPNCPAPPT